MLLQRVRRASVSVDADTVGEIGAGLVLLVGVAEGDTETDAEYLAEKTLNLRIFPDAGGRFNLTAFDTRAQLLAVSQFTLYADTRRGRRPSFVQAAPPDIARALYEALVERLRASGLVVATGRFQEHMVVALENDGPVTILLDSADRLRSRSEA